MEGMEAFGAFVENTRFGAFLRELFPGFGDMQASAVADGAVASEAEGGDGYEVAGVDPFPQVESPLEWLGGEAYRNPKAYLAYLDDALNERISILTADNQPKIMISDKYGTQLIENPNGELINTYRDVQENIERELNRFGGPRVGELSKLYEELRKVDQEWVRAGGAVRVS